MIILRVSLVFAKIVGHISNHDYIILVAMDSNELAWCIGIEHWIGIHFGLAVIYIFQLAQCGYRLRLTP